MPTAKLLWLLVPLFGVLELTAHYYFAGPAPAHEAYRELGPRVAKLAKSGDLVLMTPEWAEPNARYGLGERWMPLRDVARADESAYPRAIEISILNQSANELEGWKVISTETFGKFRLRVLENPAPAKPQYRFVDHLTPDDLQVHLGNKNCAYRRNARVSNGALAGHATFPKKRFQCSGPDHVFIGETVIDSARFRPRRCIWAHPGRAPLKVNFGRVAMAAQIRGYTGLSELKARDGKGGKVKLSVSVDGTLIGETVHDNYDGWKGFEFPTARWAGQTAEVEFVISSARPRSRHFCFQADTR